MINLTKFHQTILTLITLQKYKGSFPQWHKLTRVYRVTFDEITTQSFDHNSINTTTAHKMVPERNLKRWLYHSHLKSLSGSCNYVKQKIIKLSWVT